MGLFDSLRSKLKGVSKKLEDEVERQLGDQIERELAEAIRQEPSSPVEPVQASASAATPTHAPPATPTPAPTPPSTPSPSPAPAPVSTPSPTSAPGPTSSPAPAPAPTPSSSPAPAPTLSPTTSSTAPYPGPGAPQTGAPITPPAPEPPAVPAPALAAVPATPPGSVATYPASPNETASVAHVTPAAPISPAPAAVTAPAKQARPTGRKMLTESEIESRLERELTEAVTVQRDVEQAVRSTSSSARFTINETVLEDILWDLEVGLLESDVALPVVEAIKASVKEQLLSLPVGGKPEEVVEKVLRTAIQRVLQVNPLDFDEFVRKRLAAGKRPVVVMFVGVNGTGKTTSIGRIAHRLKTQGLSCVMAAGDTFRAGAIEQLSLHGERLGVAVVKHKAGADPAAVAYDAIEHAKARHKDVVLLDTAGRMQNNSNLMDEMDKIRRVANPDLCIFVGDSLAGNDAVEQARRFDEVVDVGGVILTKVDVDAKGGAALSVAYTIHKPLLFVGVGQGYPDLKPFDAAWLVDRLFGGEGEEPVAAA